MFQKSKIFFMRFLGKFEETRGCNLLLQKLPVA